MRYSAVLVAFSASVLASGDVQRRDASTRISNANTPPVTVKGNAFFVGDKRFYIRGVDYQPGGDGAKKDPLASTADCSRDVKYFKKLGINTVRVYAVDNSVNHDDCMKLLADAGIYLAVDVNTPGYSLNRETWWSLKASYNDVYLQSVFSTVEQFAKYDNTLLFFSANEVVNAANSTFAAPYVKAVGRDIKKFIKARNLRAVPSGYSAADVEENRFQMAQYLNCGGDDERSDFFAFNDYSWCAPSDFQKSGWDKKVRMFGSYQLPLFLSEYGCNTNKRDFGEVATLYSEKMISVYSGGLSYEYSQGDNKYGLVKIDSSGNIDELPDLAVLATAFKNTPMPDGPGGYKPDGKASTCPPASNQWSVTNTSLPIMPKNAAQYMTNGAGPGPGFNKDPKYPDGSQWAGTPTPGFAAASASSSSKKTGNSTGGAKKSEGGEQRAPGVTWLILAGAFGIALQLL
ncbi:hypothetical protein FKW77_000728 [Venturia effusa]|uniref:1,3-beta-glucanosyltransferase n=1 Tax=Venturia effusa TaxID=50376 RepID=A0A517L8G8_9PEZI|nr:hypothetical protein FKW77_000728 [Venturia effusa]